MAFKIAIIGCGNMSAYVHGAAAQCPVHFTTPGSRRARDSASACAASDCWRSISALQSNNVDRPP